MPVPVYYPVFLDIKGKNCLVVGGGSVAERKVKSLLASGAQVTVLSPESVPALRQLAAENSIRLVERGYQRGDADGFLVVIAATDDREVNGRVFADVEMRGGLVNVVDDPEHCRFIVPSTVERGSLTIAISTSGKSPAMAKRIREEIEAIFPEEYAGYVEEIAALRRKLRERLGDSAVREEAWRDLMNGGLLQLLKEGNLAQAESRLDQVVRERR